MERAASSSPSVYSSSFHNWRLGGLYARNPLQILGFSKQGKQFLRGAQASCVASCIHHCKLFEKRENSQRGATETILVNSFRSYLLAKFLLSSWPTSELKPNVSKFSWVLVIVKTMFSCRQEGAAGDLLIQAAICGYYLLQTDYSFGRNPTWETTQRAGNWKQNLAQASFKVQRWPLNL